MSDEHEVRAREVLVEAFGWAPEFYPGHVERLAAALRETAERVRREAIDGVHACLREGGRLAFMRTARPEEVAAHLDRIIESYERAVREERERIAGRLREKAKGAEGLALAYRKEERTPGRPKSTGRSAGALAAKHAYAASVLHEMADAMEAEGRPCEQCRAFGHSTPCVGCAEGRR